MAVDGVSTCIQSLIVEMLTQISSSSKSKVGAGVDFEASREAMASYPPLGAGQRASPPSFWRPRGLWSRNEGVHYDARHPSTML